MRIIDDLLPVVLVEQLRVDLLLGRFELPAHVVLFANENQLPRGGVIVVLQKVMHPEAKVVQIELAKVFACDRERIKIVLLKIATELSPTLLVSSPNETGDQKNDQRD